MNIRVVCNIIKVCMQRCIYIKHFYSECVIAYVFKIKKAIIRAVLRRVPCDHFFAMGRFSCGFIFYIFVIFSVVLSLFLIRRRKPGMLRIIVINTLIIIACVPIEQHSCMDLKKQKYCR